MGCHYGFSMFLWMKCKIGAVRKLERRVKLFDNDQRECILKQLMLADDTTLVIYLAEWLQWSIEDFSEVCENIKLRLYM